MFINEICPRIPTMTATDKYLCKCCVDYIHYILNVKNIYSYSTFYEMNRLVTVYGDNPIVFKILQDCVACLSGN